MKSGAKKIRVIWALTLALALLASACAAFAEGKGACTFAVSASAGGTGGDAGGTSVGAEDIGTATEGTGGTGADGMGAGGIGTGIDGTGTDAGGAGTGTDGAGAGNIGTDGTGMGGTGTDGTGMGGTGTDGADAGGATDPASAPDAGAADITPGVANASGLAYQDGIYQDMAEGYNDTIIITVTVRDGRITDLASKNRSGAEANEYLTRATEGLREQLIASQSVEGVDAVSGATGSSTSILEAMRGVILQATASDAGGGTGTGAAGGGSAGAQTADGAPSAAATPRPTLDPDKAEVFSGLGSTTNFRVGPGKDDEGTQVYSFNVTMANVIFDKEGKILNARVDIYEVSTPNYDGDSMPHFSGWPGKEGYSVYDPQKGGISGVSENTEESATKELSEWRTKRERGDEYGMNPQNEWYEQMNAYEGWMIGKTVAELREWFDKYTTSAGRPIKSDSQNEDDIKVYEGLNDDERQGLADVTSMATMSLSDSHGLILEAIEKAYENRVPVEGVRLSPS